MIKSLPNKSQSTLTMTSLSLDLTRIFSQICVAECLGLCVGNWLSETYSDAVNLVNVLLDEGICNQSFSALWAGFWATFFFFIYTAFTTLIKGRKKADRDNRRLALKKTVFLRGRVR